MEGWCVLRVSGRHTLRLAESLAKDGFEVWTPTEGKRIRVPRANVRRSVTLPLMPSYVFAKAERLVDLMRLADMPVKPRLDARQPTHPDFSVMRHNDRIPIIADEQLQGLRVLEAKRTPRKMASRTFSKGVEVKVAIDGGSFAGMSGVVQRSDHGTTLVIFDRRLKAKIPTSLLDEDEVGNKAALNRNEVRRAA